MTKRSKSHMVWIDCEMTGLNPDKENIIEIASLVTDGDLRVVAEGPNLVIHQPEELLAKMDAWNRKQHGKSGLTDMVRRSRISLKEAERQTLQFVRKYCFRKTAPLCGNAIDHDRKFLVRYMPKLNAYLHYRHVDVSSIKELAVRWYPKARRKPPAKQDRHRALADILESVEELRFYRKVFFRKTPAAA